MKGYTPRMDPRLLKALEIQKVIDECTDDQLDLSRRDLDELPYGVAEKTSITKLSLNGNHLSTLPESLKNLTQLKTINLTNNKFKDWPINLPSSLTSLYLSDCFISRTPHTAFFELTNLKQLSLCYNGGSFCHPTSTPSLYVPTFPVTMCHIEELTLSNARIKYIPVEIGNLINLRHLDLSANLIDGLPIQMKSLTRLEDTNLSHNRLVCIPACVASWVSLKRLDLTANALTRIISKTNEFSMINLEILELGSNKLGDSLGGMTLDLPALVSIVLIGNQLTVLPRLSERTNKVTNICIADNLLTRISYQFVKPCLKSLVRLEAINNEIHTVALELVLAHKLKIASFGYSDIMINGDGKLRKDMMYKIYKHKCDAIKVYLHFSECIPHVKRLLIDSSIMIDFDALNHQILSLLIQSLLAFTYKNMLCGNHYAIPLLTGS